MTPAEIITQAVAITILAQRDAQTGFYQLSMDRLDRARDMLLTAREEVDKEWAASLVKEE